jgi:hypothetical protein
LEKTLGRNNEYTLSAFCNTVRLLEELGRKDEAEALKEKYKDQKSFIDLDLNKVCNRLCICEKGK